MQNAVRRLPLYSAVVLAVAVASCGEHEATSGAAKSPEQQTDADAGSARAEPGPTTTTTALEDAGAASATKLAEAQARGEAAGTPVGPHHEPGRGIADIQAAIAARRADARACYDAALATHPGIEGDLVIQWTIDPKGNVSQISTDTARSQILEPTVVACVVSVVKKIQFAPSAGGYETKASFPFNFHPRRTRSSSP